MIQDKGKTVSLLNFKTMKTLQEGAKNLGVDENSETANWFYKIQFVEGKFVEVKNKKFISVADNKLLKSLVIEDDFGTSEGIIEKNKKRFSEILKSAISLEDAYNQSKKLLL